LQLTYNIATVIAGTWTFHISRPCVKPDFFDTALNTDSQGDLLVAYSVYDNPDVTVLKYQLQAQLWTPHASFLANRKVYASVRLTLELDDADNMFVLVSASVRWWGGDSMYVVFAPAAGGTLQQLGDAINATDFMSSRLTFLPTGAPLVVCYNSWTNPYHLGGLHSAWKYNGTLRAVPRGTWVKIPREREDDRPSNPAYAFAPNGTMFAAYVQGQSRGPLIVKAATVRGSQWSIVGAGVVTSDIEPPLGLQLAVSPQGDVFVAYCETSDALLGCPPRVKHLTDHGWEHLGQPSFAGSTYPTGLAYVSYLGPITLSSHGEPTIPIQHNIGDDSVLTLMKFNGTWEPVAEGRAFIRRPNEMWFKVRAGQACIIMWADNSYGDTDQYSKKAVGIATVNCVPI